MHCCVCEKPQASVLGQTNKPTHLRTFLYYLFNIIIVDPLPPYKNSQGPVMSQMNPAHKHTFSPFVMPPFLTPTNSLLASDLSFNTYPMLATFPDHLI